MYSDCETVHNPTLSKMLNTTKITTKLVDLLFPVKMVNTSDESLVNNTKEIAVLKKTIRLMRDTNFPSDVIKENEVMLQNLVDLDGTFMSTNSDYSHSIIGLIDGVETLLNSCSDRYELVTNAEIFPRIEDELNARNLDFTAEYRSTNNAVFSAKYVIENDSYRVGNDGDVIKFQLVVTHSYNGLEKYTMSLGAFRLICTNGMVIPFEGYEEKNYTVTGKHTKKIQESIQGLFAKIPEFFGEAEKFVKRYELMYDTKIENFGERVESVMDAVGISVGKTCKDGSRNTPNLDHVLATIRTEMAQLNETVCNDWLIYNGINGYIFDDEKNVKSQSVRKDLDKKVMAEILKG
jgi:hypothetical protein